MIEGRKILVVDDDRVVLRLLSDFLLSQGCDVRKAMTGKEAVSILESEDVDVAVLDIGLPDTDGLSLICEVKKSQPLCGILMLTGRHDVETVVEAMKRGADDFLSKPVDFERFLLTLFRIILERETHLTKRKIDSDLEDRKTIEFLNAELRKRIEDLTLMCNISNRISSLRISEDIFEGILSIVKDTLKVERSAFYLIDKNRTFTLYTAIPESCFEPQLILDEEEFIKITSQGRQVSKGGDVIFPLSLKGECLGVVRVPLGGRRQTNTELFLLKLITENCSIQIENRMLYDSLFESVLQTLRSLISAINRRDSYTEGHCLRVTQYSLKMAEVMNIPDYEKDSLRIAGSIHDLGKVGIPDAILLKPGRLTEEEFNVMKNHSTYGEEILGRFEILFKEAKIVRSHHERFDGKGYPDGLQGTEIPLTCRIIAVADAFDAMTTDRPYRRALAKEEAMLEIRRCSGTQFDPDVVSVFKEVFMAPKHE